MGDRGIHISTAVGRQLEKFAGRIPLCKATTQLAVLEVWIFPNTTGGVQELQSGREKVVLPSMVARMVTTESA